MAEPGKGLRKTDTLTKSRGLNINTQGQINGVGHSAWELKGLES